jgi:hypothetical protein
MLPIDFGNMSNYDIVQQVMKRYRVEKKKNKNLTIEDVIEDVVCENMKKDVYEA